MLRLLYPRALADSVGQLDWQRLWELGYRGLIFDVDNTLVPHGADADAATEALFRRLKAMGFRSLILSNNGESRVRSFLRNIDAQYLCNAGKPRPRGYWRAVRMLGLSRPQVLVIGDQVFTDVLGANLAGLDSVLVRFIGWQTETDPGKRRRAEARVLRRWEKSRRRRLPADIVIKEETNHALEQKQAVL